MEDKGKVILDNERLGLVLERLSWQLIETHNDFSDTCIVGIQPRGTYLAEKMYALLKKNTGNNNIKFGKLDITFYRDDFREKGNFLSPSSTKMDFLVEGQNVVLIDDVLYSGRTVQAALVALQHYGRPSRIELLSLVDRRFNRHIPIRPDYKGVVLDALDEAFVRVEWKDINSDNDQVILFPGKNEKPESNN